MPGKRIQFDEETLRALDLLARDSMKSFQELAAEAFADLLRKHNRPTSLREALRKSTPDKTGANQPARRRSPTHSSAGRARKRKVASL